MALINYTSAVNLEQRYVKVEWPGMETEDEGEPFVCAGLRLASSQYWGNFNGGTGKITLMASNQIAPSNFSEYLFSSSAKLYAHTPQFYALNDPDNLNFIVGEIKPVADANFISGGVALLFVPR